MGYVKAEVRVSNLLQNLRVIEEHLDFIRDDGRAYDKEYNKLTEMKGEMSKELGMWTFILHKVNGGA